MNLVNKLIILSNSLLLVFLLGYLFKVEHVLLGVFQELLILPAFGLQFGLSIAVCVRMIQRKSLRKPLYWIQLGMSLFWVSSFWWV